MTSFTSDAIEMIIINPNRAYIFYYLFLQIVFDTILIYFKSIRDILSFFGNELHKLSREVY